jgi:hypothetical protein
MNTIFRTRPTKSAIAHVPMFAVAAFASLMTLGQAAADHGDTILTVATPSIKAELTLEALMEMPQTTFTTSTIWTEGEVTFVGVSLYDLFAAYEITEGDVSAIAINDYKVTVPVTDATEDGPIVAYTMNGEEMHRRDKGPLWVVYPYDSKSSYQTETIYSRSIWQLNRLDSQ